MGDPMFARTRLIGVFFVIGLSLAACKTTQEAVSVADPSPWVGEYRGNFWMSAAFGGISKNSTFSLVLDGQKRLTGSIALEDGSTSPVNITSITGTNIKFTTDLTLVSNRNAYDFYLYRDNGVLKGNVSSFGIRASGEARFVKR